MTVRFKPDDPYFIYGLVDPRTDKVRYVGKTFDLKGRLRQHIWNALHPENVIDPDSYKNCWIRKLNLLELKPSIKLLEKTTFSQSDEREKYWVKFYGRDNLSNGNDGGTDAKYFKNISIYDYSKIHENRNRIYKKLKQVMPKKFKEIIVYYIACTCPSPYSLEDFITKENTFDKKKFMAISKEEDRKGVNALAKQFRRMNNIEKWLNTMDEVKLFTLLIEYKLGSHVWEFGGSIDKSDLEYASEFVIYYMPYLH